MSHITFGTIELNQNGQQKNGSLGICIIPTAFHATKTWITILPLPTDLRD